MFSPIEQHVQVQFNYQIAFTEGLFNSDNKLLSNTLIPSSGSGVARFICVIDEGLLEHHPDLVENLNRYTSAHQSLQSVCEPLIVPGGEPVKNKQDYVNQIQELVDIHGIDRHSYILAIGGGAVIDMAGFAAAVSHRGVRLVRIPTTVLSQNDSAVGVKNGINAYGKKNFLGSFAPPFAVLNDFSFLTTLSDRDWRSGMSEAVKVALLKDVKFFEFMEENARKLRERDMDAMKWLIYRCAELHLDHIANSGDPFETGSSRPLDFGHWAAHKLEQISGYEIRHGEAVAIGLALDSTYAWHTDMLDKDDWNRIMNLLSNLGFTLFVPELNAPDGSAEAKHAVLDGLNEFREHLGGELTIMLLEKIGQGVEVHSMQEEKILQSIKALQQFDKANSVTSTEDEHPQY